MSVPASKKQKSKAEFITNGQNLLIDIGNWVDAQKSVGKTTGLDNFFNLNRLCEMSTQFPSQYENESQRWEGIEIVI